MSTQQPGFGPKPVSYRCGGRGSLLCVLPTACLLLLAAAGPAPATESDATGISLCELGAWTTDTDPQGLNIRAAPGTDSPIIGTIPPPVEVDGDVFAAGVSITGSRGGWFRINRADFIDYYRDEVEVYFDGEGWVSGGYLGFSVEGRKLYRAPSMDAQVAVDFAEERGDRDPDEADTFVLDRLLRCQGFWVEVEGTFRGTRFRGWTNDTCPSQVTTCP